MTPTSLPSLQELQRSADSAARVGPWPDSPKDGGIRTFEHAAPADLVETRKKLMAQAIDAAAGSGGGASSSGSTSITQIVQHVNPEPSSEFEYAERIRADVSKISDPSLMVSILKVLQARMAEIKKEWAARD